MIGTPPDINEGYFISKPSYVMNGTVKVLIGAPAYVIVGNDVIINCSINSGTSPTNITWFRNDVVDLSRRNVSSITITDANDGDVFKCRAENLIGFDTKETTITEVSGKWI